MSKELVKAGENQPETRPAHRPKEKILPKVMKKINDPAVIERLAKYLTDVELAHILDIPIRTFKRYKAEDEDLLALIKKGTEQKADAIEEALVKRAVGFFYDEVTTERVPVLVKIDGKKKATAVFKIEDKPVETKRVRKFLTSDTAAIYLLRNYKPDKFNKKYGDGSGLDGENVNISILYVDNRKTITDKS